MSGSENAKMELRCLLGAKPTRRLAPSSVVRLDLSPKRSKNGGGGVDGTDNRSHEGHNAGWIHISWQWLLGGETQGSSQNAGGVRES